MAAQCHPNQPGINQIFTIYLQQDSGNLDEKHVLFCGIQVTNQQRNPQLEDQNHTSWLILNQLFQLRRTTLT
jgi:hypothetical protein